MKRVKARKNGNILLPSALHNRPMNRWLDMFREHPASVGETYVEHFGVATSFGLSLIRAGLACLIHAVLPFLFTTYARRAVADLHGRLVDHRDRRTLGSTRGV